MPVQTKHKIIIGVTAFVLIVGVGFVYSQGSSFQGALTVQEDRDRDGMRDLWEKQYGLNFTINDAASDLDSDGLTNRQEFILRTYPNDADSDDDGLTDAAEANGYGTDPLDSDSDDGTVSDGDEVTNGTDPLDGSDDVSTSFEYEENITLVDLAEEEEEVVSLPDLVADEGSNSLSISGEVFVNSAGDVWSYDTIAISTCGIRNDGSATASGPSTQRCNFSKTYVMPYNLGSPSSASSDLDLAPGEIVAFDYTYNIVGDSSTPYISFLQTLYDSGSIDVTIEYDIDYLSSSGVITEADETNNEPSYTLTIDDALITWTIQEEEEPVVVGTGGSSSNTGTGSSAFSTNQYTIAFVNGQYQLSEI